MRAALAGHRIRTLYQPVVRLRDRCPVGIEVLARLAGPDETLVGPDAFVPGMEAGGLGRALFEAVIGSAFDDWQSAGLGDLGVTLAVNLPLDVLIEPAARAWLEATRLRHRIAAESITLELTESQPLLGIPELAAAAAELRGHGYGLAIDDVGPDIRDHTPLLDLPFTILKLDRGVVQAATEPDAAAFIRGAIAEARLAGLTVVAEGVEDEATWQAMVAHGVDHVQGFLVSRPLTAAAMVAWHRERCDGQV